MDCGRKSDKSIAGQFTNIAGGVGHVFSPTAISDDSPSDLNFYFCVKATFSIASTKKEIYIYLAQGSRSLRNNWWIGGSNVAHNEDAILVITTPDGSNFKTQQVFTISGGISDINLTAWL